jgi:ribose transport system ATP-binding protein
MEGGCYGKYEFVADLTEAGAAVILATSDIQEALGFCDRLLVMHRGTIVAELTPENTTREEVLLNMMGGGIRNEVQSG